MTLKKHESRNKSAIESGNPSCIQKKQRKQQKRELTNMSTTDMLNAIEGNKNKIEANKNAIEANNAYARTNELLQQLTEQNKILSNDMREIKQQNNELKDMMIDLQNNPKLLVVCNNLYPLEQLDLKEPKFGPVLEILDKELPEYPNLGNDKTGKVHAKAIKTLNSIQLTAIKDGQEVYFKSENVLAKDKCHKTTKAFIDAIGALGYEYAQKAIGDLKSERDSDAMFKDQIISNASIDALPSIMDLQ
jgi:hypothetical protein